MWFAQGLPGSKGQNQNLNRVYSFILIHSSTSIYYRYGHCVPKQTRPRGEARVPTRLGFNFKLTGTEPDRICWVAGAGSKEEPMPWKSLSHLALSSFPGEVFRGSPNTISQELSFLLSLGETPQHNTLVHSHFTSSRTDHSRDGCTSVGQFG